MVSLDSILTWNNGIMQKIQSAAAIFVKMQTCLKAGYINIWVMIFLWLIYIF